MIPWPIHLFVHSLQFILILIGTCQIVLAFTEKVSMGLPFPFIFTFNPTIIFYFTINVIFPSKLFYYQTFLKVGEINIPDMKIEKMH